MNQFGDSLHRGGDSVEARPHRRRDRRIQFQEEALPHDDGDGIGYFVNKGPARVGPGWLPLSHSLIVRPQVHIRQTSSGLFCFCNRASAALPGSGVGGLRCLIRFTARNAPGLYAPSVIPCLPLAGARTRWRAGHLRREWCRCRPRRKRDGPGQTAWESWRGRSSCRWSGTGRCSRRARG